MLQLIAVHRIQGSGFKGLGFRSLRFSVLVFRHLGFGALGFRVLCQDQGLGRRSPVQVLVEFFKSHLTGSNPKRPVLIVSHQVP